MRSRFQVGAVVLLYAFLFLVGCTKKAAPPPQSLSHGFRVAARKWMRAIDEIPAEAERIPSPADFVSRRAGAAYTWQYIDDKTGGAREAGDEAHIQRDNDMDNAAYELLSNYEAEAFLVACDAAHQVYEGKHDPRCADGLCGGTYTVCQKEALQTLESGESIPTPQCKIGSNGHLPGWTEPVK